MNQNVMRTALSRLYAVATLLTTECTLNSIVKLIYSSIVSDIFQQKEIGTLKATACFVCLISDDEPSMCLPKFVINLTTVSLTKTYLRVSRLMKCPKHITLVNGHVYEPH